MTAMAWLICGLVLGGGIVGLLWALDHWSLRFELETAATDEGQVAIGERNYYVVDVPKYTRMRLAYVGVLEAARRNEARANYADVMSRRDRDAGHVRPEHDLTRTSATLKAGS